MKNKYVLFMILLALAFFSAACATQKATNEPGEVTSVPTVSVEESTATATQEAGEAAMTPTGAVEESTSTQEASEVEMTPNVTTEDHTPAAEADGTAGIPQTGFGDAGIPDDLNEVIRVLNATGVMVEVGDEVQQDSVTAAGRILVIDGEEVRFFTYASAEELEVQASQFADDGDPEREPRFYKIGNMLVFYAGRDPGVRDLLEDVLGAQAAGQ